MHRGWYISQSCQIRHDHGVEVVASAYGRLHHVDSLESFSKLLLDPRDTITIVITIFISLVISFVVITTVIIIGVHADA